SLPIILYNIPSRCGVEIDVETVLRLARDADNVVGLKEAGGRPDRVARIAAAVRKPFTLLSGDDSLTLPFMAVGAEGVISVASNLAPAEVSRMVRAFREGQLEEARALHGRLYPLFKALFIETNPAPIKAALAIKGWIAEELRLPLVPVRQESRERIRDAMAMCGLL
ncbi:MAG: dihydrodipicolinate synthase family protein, partial [Verrucomicrobia bacterium]|nr:dihydrodipicolinate synthase family protein [Verrucomicrobiota bacterium]